MKKLKIIHLAKTSRGEEYSQPICMNYIPKRCARSLLSVRVTCKNCQKTELYKTRLAAWNRIFPLFPSKPAIKPKKRTKIIHAVDTSYDWNGYGDSYVPYCTGPGKNANASYDNREVNCKRCRKKLGLMPSRRK